MYTILISLSIACFVFMICWKIFSAIAAILPALLAFVLAFFIISKKINDKLTKEMQELEKELQRQKLDNALTLLKNIKNKFGSWQIFLKSSIDGQIGSIYYMKGQFKSAKPFLEKAFVKHWVAKAMLAVIYYRERNYKKMEEIFEKAISFNKKSGLLWSLWAYCLWRNGDNEKAIKILSKGKTHLGDKDPILTSNLLMLQNQKKMKMRGYQEQWYQFQLEMPPSAVQMRQGRVRFQHR